MAGRSRKHQGDPHRVYEERRLRSPRSGATAPREVTACWGREHPAAGAIPGIAAWCRPVAILAATAQTRAKEHAPSSRTPIVRLKVETKKY